MNKVNVKEFLLNNCLGDNCYATIKRYRKGKDSNVEFVYFSRQKDESGDWFLESPCHPIKIMEVEGDVDTFCNNYIETVYILENGTNKESFINDYIKPMIIDGWLYEIDTPQCSPYIGEEVHDIQIVSASHLLRMMLR